MNRLTKNSEQSLEEVQWTTRTYRQINKIRKTIHEQNEKFSKEIDIIKKEKNPKQTEILELKKTGTKLNNLIESLSIKLDQAEGRISKLEDRSFEIIQSKEQKEKKNEKEWRKSMGLRGQSSRETIWGLPWWRSGWESACRWGGHGFRPWFGRIPHAVGQLGPWATIAEPARLEPVLRNKRGRDGERPTHRDEEWLLLATTGESPRTETKSQHNQE